MLKFDKKVTDIITENTRVSRKQFFTYYGSKKQLANAEVLSAEVLEYVTKIKGAYGFDIHISNKYMLIYVYEASDKSYKYYVMDLNTFAIAQVSSPKVGKDGICELIATEKDAEASIETETATLDEKTNKKAKNG